ncbi:P80 family lipoprotein [Mesomycoplasma hyopneumoniae]
MINKALADPKKPAKIKEEDKPYFAEFQKLAKEKTGDIKEIERIWKKYVSDDQGLAGYEFRRSDLENFTDLQKLSSRILRSFPEALSGGSTDSAKSVLGIDNQATLFLLLPDQFLKVIDPRKLPFLIGKRI